MPEVPSHPDQPTLGNEQSIRELLSQGVLNVKKIFREIPYPPGYDARLSDAFLESNDYASQYYSEYRSNIEFLRQFLQRAKAAKKDTSELEKAMHIYQTDAENLQPYVETYSKLRMESEPLTDQEHRQAWNEMFVSDENISGYDARLQKKVWEYRGLDASFTTWGDFWLKVLNFEDASLFDDLKKRMRGKPVIDLGGGAERIAPLCVLTHASAYVNVDTNILDTLSRDVVTPPRYGFYDARPLLPELEKRMLASDKLSRSEKESGGRSLRWVEWRSRIGDTAMMIIPDLIQHILPVIKDHSANLVINGWGVGGVHFSDAEMINVVDHVKRIVPPGGVVLTTGSEELEKFLKDGPFTRIDSQVNPALHVLVRNGQ